MLVYHHTSLSSEYKYLYDASLFGAPVRGCDRYCVWCTRALAFRYVSVRASVPESSTDRGSAYLK